VRLPISEALGRALAGLPQADRRLLRLRFQQGWPIVRIARALRMDQRVAYRRFDRIFRGLRASLNEACGAD
jgi:DNA-directed RNA polymerase specialized sigma24 family protein